MSRQFTKVPAHKAAPKKKVVRPMPKMSALLRKSSGFRKVGA